MYQIVLFVHVVIAIVLISLILVQQGKGAGMGAGFGGGASQTVFGSRGSGSFLLKMTGGIATCFFITSLWLGYMVASEYRGAHKLDLPAQTQPRPVAPVQVDIDANKAKSDSKSDK